MGLCIPSPLAWIPTSLLCLWKMWLSSWIPPSLLIFSLFSVPRNVFFSPETPALTVVSLFGCRTGVHTCLFVQAYNVSFYMCMCSFFCQQDCEYWTVSLSILYTSTLHSPFLFLFTHLLPLIIQKSYLLLQANALLGSPLPHVDPGMNDSLHHSSAPLTSPGLVLLLVLASWTTL